MTKRLRLLKVLCQPIFVLDDGETLVEQVAQPVEVSAAEWPTFATARFVQAFEALQQQIESDPNG
jgi:hypothetical protein